MYLGPIPNWLQNITNKVSHHFESCPDQVIVNEYLPGQGIAPHIDCPTCFGKTIASLSLLSPVKMHFAKGNDKQSILLQPQSLLILMGEARTDWTHGINRTMIDLVDSIPIERSRRVSLTFRTMILGG